MHRSSNAERQRRLRKVPSEAGSDPPASTASNLRLALASLSFVAGLLTTACSTVAPPEETGSYGDATSGSEGTQDDDESETSGQDESESEGTTGTGTEGEAGDDGPPSFADARLDAPQCDPYEAQVLTYDLAEANAELTPPLVRELVLAGGEVPKLPLSPRPFLNHFEFDYASADGPTFELEGEVWKPPMVNLDQPTRYRLQFALRAPALGHQDRPPVDLAIVVDLGPSMAGEPLMRVSEALEAISAALREGDRVTLIAAGESAIELGSVFVDGQQPNPALPSLLGDVVPGSSAAIDDALAYAYASFEEQPLPEAHSRVVLLTNGQFVVDEVLAEQIADWSDDGHYLVGVGVGSAVELGEPTLRKLGHVGKGASLYAPTGEALWLALYERFTATLISSASDVEVTLHLPAGLALGHRDPLSGGLPGEELLGMLGPNDALVFHHELETCGELAADAKIRVDVEWSDAELEQAKLISWELPVSELEDKTESSKNLLKGAATTAYVDALRAYRDGEDASIRYGALLDALGLISDALEALPEDADLIEMSEVLAKLESQP